MKRCGLLLLAILCLSPCAWATWTFNDGVVTARLSSFSSTNSTSITIGSTTAGTVGVVCLGITTSTMSLSSISGGGTWTIKTEQGNTRTAQCAYNLNMSASTTSLSLTLTGNCTGTAFYYNLSYTLPSVAFDTSAGDTFANGGCASSGTVCAAPSLTLSPPNNYANYVFFQASAGGSNPSSINGGYTFQNGGVRASAYLVNQSSYSAPSWTYGSSGVFAGMAIALYEYNSNQGTISRNGSCEATSNSCTLSASNSGDLLIASAYGSGNTCNLSSVPSGWTSIDYGTVGAGLTKVCWAVACSVSTGGTTTSGTWSGASAVAAASYGGTNVGNAGNCDTTGIGDGNQATTGASTSTFNFPTIGLQNSNGTSWVVGLLMTSIATSCNPPYLTNTSATANYAQDCDTAGTVTSWSSQNMTVGANGNYATEVLELLVKVSAVGTQIGGFEVGP